ncbi:hypothetical protein J1N35_028877 [Gossypium stocksii]|uniref:Uncharacterized protein n=1 Tax=Gossypium stocksii TaxID=47602 RepID=A0A9D3UX74_9ROSI|nr:hypothetical protein J1N35_028877 [Gossypium stocksii]
MIEFDMAKLVLDQVVSHAKKSLEGKLVSAEPVEQTVEEEDEPIKQADHETTSITVMFIWEVYALLHLKLLTFAEKDVVG